MNEQEFKSLIEKQGVHSFIVVLSTQSVRAAASQDFWLRWMISALASISVAGLGLAWRNVAKTAELEVRLVRAAELNTRLKEMNLAAAGLAHETRNPLNIIRGLAQMLSKQPEASAETRKKVPGHDRTGRPRHRPVERVYQLLPPARSPPDRRRPRRRRQRGGAHRWPTTWRRKTSRLKLQVDPITIEADERLLRQLSSIS